MLGNCEQNFRRRLKGHNAHIHFGRGFEQFGAQILRATCGHRSNIGKARIGLGKFQQIAQRFDDDFSGQFATHPALIERSLNARRQLRDATFEVFAPEFASLAEAARDELADAIGAALSLDTWTVLRRRDGLSLERAIAVWRLTLTALLSQALGAQKA